jgi:hypothetical protein
MEKQEFRAKLQKYIYTLISGNPDFIAYLENNRDKISKRFII